ncbi:hypothetical protein R5W24_000310 [Gemmata sp. JC717]|uniref:hypothetical protein n=1 Tax=Gemmata algarum TaxID=2975278 RepID=UPI0021BB5084|nr:hypothetical protein [Gemmata algarum]MDY3551235.1 hypothetical protein [Gemmata algarum]
MAISVTCPGCSARLNAPAAAAGKTLTCPKCRAAVPVPAGAAPAFEVVEDEPPAPAPAAPGEQPVGAAETGATERGEEVARRRASAGERGDRDEEVARRRAPAGDRDDRDGEDRPPRRARRGPPGDQEDPRPARRGGAAEGGDGDDDRPRRRRGPDADRDGDDRPRRRRPRDRDADRDDRPRRSVLPLLLLGGMVVVVAGAGALAGAAYWFGFFGTEAAKPGAASGGPPVAAVTSQWTDFERPNSGFRVRFPWGIPNEGRYTGALGTDRGSLPQSVTGVRLATYYSTRKLEVDTSAPPEKRGLITNYEFGLVVVTYAPGTPPDRRGAAVDAVVATLEVPAGLKAGEAKGVTWAGRPAQETVYAAEPGAGAGGRQLVVRRLVTESAGYVGLVRDAGGLKPPELALFFDSLDLSAGSKKEPGAAAEKPTLPPAPDGWVPFTDAFQRFAATVPPGGVTAVRGGRLAFLEEVGKGQLLGGDYNEIRFRDTETTLSVRLLNFAPATTPADRTELLAKYVRRMAGPLPEGAKTEKLTWATLDAVEEASEAGGTAEVRRYAAGKSVGFVVTLRGPRGADFDARKAAQFAQFLPNPDAPQLSTDGKLQDWPWFISADAMYRVSVPTPAVKTDALDKVMEGAKLTGAFHTVTKDGLVFHVGHVRYPAGATDDDRRRAREALATALGRPGAAGLPRPVNFSAASGRQLAWQDYQRRGTGEQPGFRVRFHEFDGGAHVLSAHGVGVFTATDANIFFQSFVLLY